MKVLPKGLTNLVRLGYVLGKDPKPIWSLGGHYKILNKSNSKFLYRELKNDKYKKKPRVDIVQIYKRPDWAPLPSPLDPVSLESHYTNNWKIKHPTLIAYWLKVMLKDIFSNASRFRLFDH